MKDIRIIKKAGDLVGLTIKAAVELGGLVLMLDDGSVCAFGGTDEFGDYSGGGTFASDISHYSLKHVGAISREEFAQCEAAQKLKNDARTKAWRRRNYEELRKEFEGGAA